MVRFETKKCGEIGKLMWFKSSDLKKIKSIIAFIFIIFNQSVSSFSFTFFKFFHTFFTGDSYLFFRYKNHIITLNIIRFLKYLNPFIIRFNPFKTIILSH